MTRLALVLLAASACAHVAPKSDSDTDAPWTGPISYEEADILSVSPHVVGAQEGCTIEWRLNGADVEFTPGQKPSFPYFGEPLTTLEGGYLVHVTQCSQMLWHMPQGDAVCEIAALFIRAGTATRQEVCMLKAGCRVEKGDVRSCIDTGRCHVFDMNGL